MSGGARTIARFSLCLSLLGCTESKAKTDLASPRPTPISSGSAVPSPIASASAAPKPAGSAESAPLLVVNSAARVSASTVAPAELEAAVRANNEFAVALFAQLRRSSKGQNLLTSPLSASLALTMASAGARGETAREIAATLHIHDSRAIFAGQNALAQALLGRGNEAFATIEASPFVREKPSPSDFHVQVVNSIWGQADYAWEAPFLRTLAENYGAGLTAADFRSQFEPARKAINAWVSKETADKINDLLPEGSIDQSTRMVLVNALHLKLPWAKPFSAEDTKSAPFTHADGKQSTRRFMHLEADFAYRDDGAAQIVSLPLAGQQLTVLVALPHRGISLDQYERSLRAGAAALSPPPQKALVALSLPKTSFTTESFSLREVLQALGMKRAFDRVHADFLGMCSHLPDGDNLYLTDVVQKAMIELQEKGIEAAAATAVLTAVAASARLNPPPPPVPIPMVVNRPYLISVVDAPTGTVLLLGQINDPSDEGSK